MAKKASKKASKITGNEEKKFDNKPGSYTAKDIYVLEGLDPVRKRPGMYIGSTGVDGLHHLIWEVVDNSLDEAMAGYAKNIEIVVEKDNRIRVTDDGRGIPVEKHAQTKKSALETVMTTLHAGGKFGGEAYKISGGLHGVGVSVVCALSEWMRAEVKRDGFLWVQEYKKGKVVAPVKKGEKVPKDKTGTTVIFEPDPEIFKEMKFDWKRIINHLRQQAYLTPGVRVLVRDAREELPQTYTFYFEGGLVAYLRYLLDDTKVRHETPFYIKGEKEGVMVEVTMQYTEEIDPYEESFANNIMTGEGGMHLTGFRTAITRVLNDWARKNGYLKEAEENLSGDDVREGLVTVVSVKIREPQFEGQTKAKLGNPEARIAVEAIVSAGLQDYLERNMQDGRAIVERAILASKARKAAKAARETIIRRGVLEGLSLPGKLADCITRKPEESEIFIVEGDSAGGSAKQGRDRRFQAILPLRGKILNVERARLDKMLDSKEIKSLVIALGTAIAADFDITKLRYHRIIIATDADVDGSHIRTLLLTLFYRHFLPVVEQGFVYIAQPPLYKLQSGKRMEYAYREEDKEEIMADMKKEKGSINIQRYKGLGEMNPDQLWETTMNPANRVLKQVTIADAKDADKMFDILMGEEVSSRKKFIQTYAKSAKNIDI